MDKIRKKIAFWRKKIKKEIRKVNFEKPSIEDMVFAFLVVFSLFFSAFLFGIGKQIQKESALESKVNHPSQFERSMDSMVAGHPIERMIPFIAKQNKYVAAYLIAIAKKESNWGLYHPEKNGRECFNYWGYRGTYNQTDSGYSCFKNPQQAVNVVGGRIRELLSQNIKTPSEMVVWKCGQNCLEHDPESVDKWIDDVAYYNKKVKNIF